MDNLPIVLNNYILSYLNIHDLYFINRKINIYRKDLIKEKGKIINKYVFRYYKSYKTDVNLILDNIRLENNLIKFLHKTYYPLVYRRRNILLSITKLSRINELRKQKILEIYINCNKKNIYTSYKKFVDILTEDELLYNGW